VFLKCFFLNRYSHNNQEVIEMIRARKLLECPDQCPANIYNLMLECWQEQPFKRPPFSELHQRLRNLKAVYSNGSASTQSNSQHPNSKNSSNLLYNNQSAGSLKVLQFGSRGLSQSSSSGTSTGTGDYAVSELPIHSLTLNHHPTSDFSTIASNQSGMHLSYFCLLFKPFKLIFYLFF
jgi:hypothetical protein